MPHNQIIKRFCKISFFLWSIALIQSLLAVVGIFTITGNEQVRTIFGVVELVTMAFLIINSINIMRFTAQQKNSLAYFVSKLCLLALLFCFIGDIVNRNFLQQFYQYDNIIKHSYLADSVLFFFPGYLILVAAITYVAIIKDVSKRFMTICTLLTATIALYTYSDMHITGTSMLLTLITSSYSVLVSILAMSAIWLLKAFKWRQASLRIWLVALGLILAMVADAVIGKFWIFGNNGEGYFPLVSHINWIIYIGSQVLIQQLPIALVQNKHQ